MVEGTKSTMVEGAKGVLKETKGVLEGTKGVYFEGAKRMCVDGTFCFEDN